MRNLTYKFIPNYRGHLITWETGVSPSPAPGQPGVGVSQAPPRPLPASSLHFSAGCGAGADSPAARSSPAARDPPQPPRLNQPCVPWPKSEEIGEMPRVRQWDVPGSGELGRTLLFAHV